VEQIDLCDMAAKLGPQRGLVYDDRILYRIVKDKRVLQLLADIEHYVCWPYRYLCSIIDTFSKLRWVVALRTKEGDVTEYC
jgi:hypothetical protein